MKKKEIQALIGRMSNEEKIAQTLIFILPTFDFKDTISYVSLQWLREYSRNHGLGGYIIIKGSRKILKGCTDFIREANMPIPPVVVGDLESGTGIFEGGTVFPDPLALGAAGDPELAYEMGKATAIEGRQMGFHWTYSPVIDVILNPNNPITQNRAMGDDPEKIASLACAYIKGLQDQGMAACVKHFPGDGTDDLDQHLATPVNALSKKKWTKIFKKLYKDTIKAGVWSIMAGHIALPAFDETKDAKGMYTPASLSKPILTDLLRGSMRFKGLTVSDAMGMGGLTGSRDEPARVVEAFNAGCDMLLFASKNYPAIMKKAVESGEITEARLDEAVTRIMDFKNKTGLLEPQNDQRRIPSPEEKKAFQKCAETIAEKSVFIVRNLDNAVPAKITENMKILTATLGRGGRELPVIDKELRARGYDVTHVINPHRFEFEKYFNEYDRFFINFLFPTEWATGSCRSIGEQNRIFLSDMVMKLEGRAVYTSFGNPYHLRDFPQLPNYINTHSPCELSQKHAVKIWLGEADAGSNQSPVSGLTRY